MSGVEDRANSWPELNTALCWDLSYDAISRSPLPPGSPDFQAVRRSLAEARTTKEHKEKNKESSSPGRGGSSSSLFERKTHFHDFISQDGREIAARVFMKSMTSPEGQVRRKSVHTHANHFPLSPEDFRQRAFSDSHNDLLEKREAYLRRKREEKGNHSPATQAKPSVYHTPSIEEQHSSRVSYPAVEKVAPTARPSAICHQREEPKPAGKHCHHTHKHVAFTTGVAASS